MGNLLKKDETSTVIILSRLIEQVVHYRNILSPNSSITDKYRRQLVSDFEKLKEDIRMLSERYLSIGFDQCNGQQLDE